MIPDELAERVFSALVKGRATLALAESCTGGLVAHRLTDIAGISEWFLGGVVAYSNEAKVNLLGVDPAALAAHGAVSEPVARQMARGARQRFGAQYGIGITGIAGPGGGSSEKPVGLVYIAVEKDGEQRAVRNEFQGNRREIKAQSADKALQMLLELMGG